MQPLEEKLKLIENTEKAIKQTKSKLNDLLEPFSAITFDIEDRKDFLDIFTEKKNATIKLKAYGLTDWETGETEILCDIDLSDSELLAIKNIIEQSIDTMLENVNFLKITDLCEKLAEINK